MELKLNVYDKKEVVKTYTAETYDILFGTVEDLVEIIDLDSVQNGNDGEIIKLALKLVINGMDILKPLLKDIFDGLTDEELKKTKVSEVANVLVEVVKFTISQIMKGQNSKN